MTRLLTSHTVRLAVLLSIVGLSVDGCGSSSVGTGPTSETFGTSVQTTVTQPDQPEVSVTTSCVDKTGDSTGPLDLTRVNVREEVDTVTITYRWRGDVPAAGTVLWSTNFTGPDAIKQLGYKILDGEVIAQFVFDAIETKQTDSGTADLGTRKLVARFDGQDVGIIGVPRTWTATLSVEGLDTDSCRQSGG